MSMALTTNADSIPCVSLDGAVDVGGAFALRSSLTELPIEGNALVVDLGCVERMDAAGVQLLLAFDAWLKRSGVSLSLVLPEGPARRALEGSGALARFTLLEGETDFNPGDAGDAR